MFERCYSKIVHIFIVSNVHRPFPSELKFIKLNTSPNKSSDQLIIFYVFSSQKALVSHHVSQEFVCFFPSTDLYVLLIYQV